MFISGGIGVTPFLSLAKNSILERFAGRELKLIRFLWTGREQNIIDEIIATEFDSFKNEEIDWRLYLTKDKLVRNGTFLDDFIIDKRMDLNEEFENVKSQANKLDCN